MVGYVSYEAAPALRKISSSQGPLLGEYLLYFTVHDRVETSTIPLTYEEVDFAIKLAGSNICRGL